MRRAAWLCLLLLAVGAPSIAETDPAGYVDPFIGTGGHGHTYPGATLPFGMLQLSPDTRLEGWDGCSGYHYSDEVVYGFSHTHLSGTGISDYGDILLMPTTGEPQMFSGYGATPDHGYASRFDKTTELAEPGYYAVELADYGISVELTATERVGMHRYRFPRGEQAHVTIDLAHRDEVVESLLRLVDEQEIHGFRRSTGWAKDQVVYFVARFSRPIVEARLADVHGNLPRPGDREVEGKNLRAVLSFGDAGGELLVKVGISAVDPAGARRNLEDGIGRWDFDAVRARARRSWNDALSRIEVEGGTKEQREIFYTALYHSLLAPNLYSDADFRYRGMDGEIHRAHKRRHYTVFSLWDTFRATHPLLTLIEPQRAGEFVETFLAMYEQGGRLPVWELAANETDTMIGYHAIPVIVDAWVKGIRGFDPELALQAMIDSATRDHFGLEAYRRQGFIGSEDDGESVSKTLEYAYDDWCIARMAQGLGQDQPAAEFDRRGQAWRHLLDPESGFMRARRNQRWIAPFDPRRVDNHYTEANAWQYSFFVPHDTGGLIDALGGDERFIERLDDLFTDDGPTTGRDQADITGLIGQYAHGNEPSHHMAWLYHHAGRPDLSAQRVRRILDELYSAEPDGLSGNEDCGQMSSWYVFAAAGIYPVTPGTDEYVLGVPIFDSVTFHLGGKRFTIRREATVPGAAFVESARLNGKPLTRSFLRHGEIARGGDLELVLSTEPGLAWGRALEDRPHSRNAGPVVLAAPFARVEDDRFRERLEVELASGEDGVAIRYSPDPDLDRAEWSRYDGPIVLHESTRLSFVAERGSESSPVVEAYFHELPNAWSVEVQSEPNSQYTAGGPDALIDGLRGDGNWRTGGWQGYQGTDFVVVVDLGETRPVHHAGASFLQDARSWIWMPTELIVSISQDGEEFRELAYISTDVRPTRYGVFLRDLLPDLGGVEARYVRLHARNFGTIPAWHPGHGGESFIFVDEILIDW